MRKIAASSIFVFAGSSTVCLVLSVGAGALMSELSRGWALRSELSLLAFALVFYSLSLLVFRFRLSRFRIEGRIGEDDEAQAHVYQMFYLLVFGPLIRTGVIPVPMTRLFYKALGAQIAENSYTAGVIYDAHLIKIGTNCLLGERTLLTPHQMEGSTLAFYPIEIGDSVTIGAHAVILPDVRIEDGAMVAAGSVVKKGTRISRNEIWGGVPAKKIGMVQAEVKLKEPLVGLSNDPIRESAREQAREQSRREILN